MLYDLLKGGQPYEIIFLPREGCQALTEFVSKLHQASLVRYNPNIPIQGWILLGKKDHAGCHCSVVTTTKMVEHTTLGGTPRVYFLVDQITDMIIKIRDTSLQHYGKDPSKLIIPFKIKDLEWAARHCS